MFIAGFDLLQIMQRDNKCARLPFIRATRCNKHSAKTAWEEEVEIQFFLLINSSEATIPVVNVLNYTVKPNGARYGFFFYFLLLKK